MSNPETLQKQDGFQSKWGFIMACIGSAVGMANIWRFPYMVASYGDDLIVVFTSSSHSNFWEICKGACDSCICF